MIRLSTNDRRDEGAVAVIVAICTLLFVVLAAFAVDIGNAYAQSRQLSVAADAAALAAAAKVGEALPLGVDCAAALAATPSAQTIAQQVANDVNAASNKANGAGATEPVDLVSVGCADAKTIEVTVKNSRSVQTGLAGVIGIDRLLPNADATARYARYSTAGGLRPWAICDDTVERAQNDESRTFGTGIDRQIGPCGSTANGNWGGVDFDGGNNAAGDLVMWTRYGYPGAVQIPNPLLPADPGVSLSQLDSAFRSLVNQVVLLPSVSAYNEGSGNNATFNTPGIATVQFCGAVYSGNVYNTENSGAASACWVNPAGTTATGGSMALASNVVTIPTASFTAADVGDMIIIDGAALDGPDNGGNPDALSTYITGFVSATQVTVELPAQVAAANVLIRWGEFVTEHKTTGQGEPVDHIQFRYVDYSVSSFPGTGSGTSCDFTNRNCAGGVSLYR
jgi:hypothetical protein